MDAAHHAREFTTISMVVYSMLRVLHGYVHEKNFYSELLRENALVFIPAVNYDGVAYISKAFDEHKKFASIRKSRHIYEGMESCKAEDQGVDLNRNYGFEFAHDDEGSTDLLCNSMYRGPSAFSEPETQAMRKLCTTFTTIRVALNMHTCACGPLFVIPFNFDDERDDFLNKDKFEKAHDFYQTLYDESVKEIGYKLGNGAQTIAYEANGEASDWMLGKRHIYAISPELGIEDKKSEEFWIKSAEVLEEVLKQNFSWVEAILLRFFPKLSVIHEGAPESNEMSYA